MSMKELLTDERARKIFGKREIEIAMKQVEGQRLTQSERNRLSRDIRPKLEFIREAAKLEQDFDLKRNMENKRIMGNVVEAILEDELKDNIKAVLLFGSFADNTFTSRSDIDACAVFRKEISLKDATKFRMRISGQVSKKADVQVFNILPQKLKMEIARKHRILYKARDFDNVSFTLKYLKSNDYFLRMEKIFEAEA